VNRETVGFIAGGCDETIGDSKKPVHIASEAKEPDGILELPCPDLLPIDSDGTTRSDHHQFDVPLAALVEPLPSIEQSVQPLAAVSQSADEEAPSSTLR